MMNATKTVTVAQAATICRVGRTTVGYWIRSKKVFARRIGRNYVIPVEDLLHFLKSSGQMIPLELGNGGSEGPVFRSFQTCWQFWQGKSDEHQCGRCPAFRHQVEDCFSVRDNGNSGCPDICRQCRYYQDMFVARFQFIHQINFPAAVFKGLNLWGGNADWAEMCEVSEDELIGLGIEKIIHASSLPTVISSLKRIAMEEKAGGVAGDVFINTPRRGKLAVSAWVFPLRAPAGTFLMLAGPAGSKNDPDPQNP
jgi:excisionase family DNA binding protein